MTSPWRRVDTSSPSTRAIGEDGRRRRSGHMQHSPYKQKSGSSSTDVWDEFSRLYIDGERISQKNLDEQIASQERRHNEALAAAAAEHERVREAAERAREKVELEIERERKRREDEDIRALEAERRAKEEREAAERRRLKEDLERQEEAQRKRAAEEKDIETTRVRLAEQKRRDEAQSAEQKRRDEAQLAEQKRRDEADAARRKNEQEDADRRAKAREDAAATAAAAATATATTTATATAAVAAATPATPTATTSSPLAEREALHARYLDLHKRMKAMRKYVVIEGKKNPALNKTLGNWRRDLTTAMGQMTTEKGGHRGPLQKIVTILKEAQQFPEPSVDVSSYLISVAGTGSAIPMSGPFIYLLNIFLKVVLSQVINERAKIAEPIMVTAVSIFANNTFQANGTICLIDMLMAKYHAVCPVLWGIYGNEKTAKGRARIGWQRDKDHEDKEAWIGEQQHIERMVGLAAGYAALSLRDFSKSRMQNPYPPVNYWKTMSYIVNTPPSEIQPTHLTVLKALVDGYIPRFVGFYGQAALVALRKALVEFPAQAQKGPARDAVMVMPETIRKDMMLTL